MDVTNFIYYKKIPRKYKFVKNYLCKQLHFYIPIPIPVQVDLIDVEGYCVVAIQ